MWQTVVERWQFLTKEQKLSVVLLGVCGFLSVGLSAYRLHASIGAPFLADRAAAVAFKQGLTPTEDEVTDRQRRTDSDGDGISDWDETNVYKTNPYLKDTCGDGVTDNVRITTGKNVNCGKVPGSDVDTSALEATSTNFGTPPAQLTPDAVFSDMMKAAGATAGVTAESSAALDGTIPRLPAAIRAALAGKVDQAQLDAVSDAQLLEYYDMALQEQNAAQATSTS